MLRFRTAQDAFFARRSQNFAERDAEFDANAAAKRALLDEAEKIDAGDPDAARAALRNVQERWEAIGKVPRDDIRPLEARMRAVEERVREAVDRQWRRSDPEAEARVAQFRERVAQFEAQAAKARAAGDARGPSRRRGRPTSGASGWRLRSRPSSTADTGLHPLDRRIVDRSDIAVRVRRRLADHGHGFSETATRHRDRR